MRNGRIAFTILLRIPVKINCLNDNLQYFDLGAGLNFRTQAAKTDAR